MKTKYSIIFVLILFFFCTNHIVLSQNSINNVTYKIKKIERSNLYDIIYAQKNDSLFKIVSLIDTNISNSEPLEVKKKYSLNLIRIYPNQNIEKKASEAEIGAIDSCFMSIEKKNHNSLYVATNLNGFYLIENNKDIPTLINRLSIFTIFCYACKNNKFLLRLYFK